MVKKDTRSIISVCFIDGLLIELCYEVIFLLVLNHPTSTGKVSVKA